MSELNNLDKMVQTLCKQGFEAKSIKASHRNNKSKSS